MGGYVKRWLFADWEGEPHGEPTIAHGSEAPRPPDHGAVSFREERSVPRFD